MRTMNSSVAPTLRGGCSVSVLDQGAGAGGNCPSGIGRAEKETVKWG